MRNSNKKLSLKRSRIQQKNNKLSEDAILLLSIVESAPGGRISEEDAHAIFIQRKFRQRLGKEVLKAVKELQRNQEVWPLSPVDYEILRLAEKNPALMADGECLAQAIIDSGLADELGESLRGQGADLDGLSPEQVLALALGA